MLPQLRELEHQFGSSLAVVGVHSGKFLTERDTAHIRDASLRLDAIHPIVNDWKFRVWRSYAVRAWPTLVAIDPSGYVVGMHAGEFTAEQIAPFLEQVAARARNEGTLTDAPTGFPADAPSARPSALSFPGKVAVERHRIAIADSGNHRVVIGTLSDDGTSMRVERIVGGDEAGYREGADTRFNNPQGVVFDRDTLFVADAGNHAVRSIACENGHVRTLAGIGRQARTRRDIALGALSSPWDLAVHAGTLHVAMAGMHQLWTVDTRTGSAAVHAGSGAEELHDGPLATSALAQPMGICLLDEGLCFTDSESSAVRVASLSRAGAVSTIVGTGLFDFGNADGAGDAVRLQHPQAVVGAPDGRLLVADSYNGALKWVDPSTRRVETWITGLQEPSGLAIANGRVYVAETNVHRVVVVDLATGELQPLSWSS